MISERKHILVKKARRNDLQVVLWKQWNLTKCAETNLSIFLRFSFNNMIQEPFLLFYI